MTFFLHFSLITIRIFRVRRRMQYLNLKLQPSFGQGEIQIKFSAQKLLTSHYVSVLCIAKSQICIDCHHKTRLSSLSFGVSYKVQFLKIICSCMHTGDIQLKIHFIHPWKVYFKFCSHKPHLNIQTSFWAGDYFDHKTIFLISTLLLLMFERLSKPVLFK